jgi:GT2 family glycosyltransferase
MRVASELDGPFRQKIGSSAQTTVVVMTRNRRSTLARTLTRLRALPERPPVIVVDNGSDDGTSGLIEREFSDVALISLEENAGPAARTLGVEAAKTPYIAFADDDSWWWPGALRMAEDVFARHSAVGLIAARTLVGPERIDDPINASMRESPLDRDPSLPGPSVLGFLACAALVRRSAFLEVGGFTESAMGFEETALAVEMARRGWALVYIHGVLAEHHPAAEREESARRRTHHCNAVLFAWRRRPFRIALRRTLAVLRQGRRDAAALQGLLDAARETRRLRGERDVVDERLEASLRRLDL